MKCPICHGKGRIQDHKYNEEHDIEYLVYCEKKCEYCNGTGEVQMTNEEWIKSLDTEQLAEWLVFKRKLLRIPETNYEVWIQWLKEKHK